MLSVLIPAYNEADVIAVTVSSLINLNGVDQVVVVDDGSEDETGERAAAAGAEVLRLERNQGKGAALNAGVALLSGPVVALLDGDLGESARQVELLVKPVLAGEADMTIATFPVVRGSGGFGLVKGLARWGIRSMSGYEAVAPLSGQRVMKREVLEEVIPFAEGYGVEVALTVRAARKGYVIKEVPTTMAHHVTGKDLAGFLHRGKQFWHVTKTLWQLSRQG